MALLQSKVIEKIGDGFWGTSLKRFLGFEEWYFPSISIEAAYQFISLRILQNAEEELLFVVGSLNPTFFENPNFKNALTSFINRTGGNSVKIICGKPSLLIKQENPFLYGLAINHSLEIYVTPKRPTYHFICIDSCSLFIEELHEQGVPPNSYFMEMVQAAKKYREKFFTLIEGNVSRKIII